MRAIVGANVASDPASEGDARHVLAMFGGPTKLVDGRQAPLRAAKRESGPKLDYPFELARLGFISNEDIPAFLSQQCRVPVVDLSEYVVAPEIIALLTEGQCRKYGVLPVSRAGASLIVAMVDPTNVRTIADLADAAGMTIEPVIASEREIEAAMDRYYDAHRRA